MHRRRAGGRARAARLPATTTAAVLCIALLTGCGSGGATAPSSSVLETNPPISSSPVSAEPVSLPGGPSPTPIRRTVKRPAGAQVVPYETCSVVTDIVALYLRNQIFAAGSRDAQVDQLRGIGPLLDPQIRKFRKARATWLQLGYPTSFPVVRDLDAMLADYTKIHQAAASKDVDPLPAIYTDLQKAAGQYFADTNPGVCEQ
jgi:hypothetical protein